ncbi:MAG: hypothetical protein VB861_13585, partial [Planctomycetaceae bacterium]
MHRFASLMTLMIVPVLSLVLITQAPTRALAQTKPSPTATKKAPPKPDFPPHALVLKDFKKVVSSTDVTRTL